MNWEFVIGVVGLALISGFGFWYTYRLTKRPPEIPEAPKVFKDEWEPETPAPTTTVEYWEEQSASDIPIEDFNELFEKNKIIIEKETFGYTKDYEEWVKSDAKFHIPRHCGPAFYLFRDSGFASYATAESFMVDGVVYAMDIRKPKMFSNSDELMEYAKTLFAVYLVYVGVSPIDKETKRLFIVGCTAEDGVVPTHGL